LDEEERPEVARMAVGMRASMLTCRTHGRREVVALKRSLTDGKKAEKHREFAETAAKAAAVRAARAAARMGGSAAAAKLQGLMVRLHAGEGGGRGRRAEAVHGRQCCPQGAAPSLKI
jgi:hypothetical protein